MSSDPANMKYLAAIGASLMLAAACGTPAEDAPAQVVVTDRATSDQLLLASTKVALPPVGFTVADLPHSETPGARLVAQYCVTCHGLPSPGTHSATDWPVVVRRMWLRMDKIDPTFGVQSPAEPERMVLLNYLTENALKVSTANLPDAPGRDAFVTTCSQCHDLPDPQQHAGADWVPTIRRMMTHMEDLLGDSMSQRNIETISTYLRTASGA